LEIERLNLDFLSINGNLIIARDDVYPLFLGGNKARKMVKIIEDIENKSCNAVVTTGGIQSNHCRVAALACASKGWECILILHGSGKQFFSEKGNALIMRLSNAKVIFVDAANIGPAMDQAMVGLKDRGLNPYYLPGGGHNKAGVTAYIEAVKELKDALPSGYIVNNIFLASGTGSTQAGIIAGCRSVGWTGTRVIGISIARQKQRGIASINQSLNYISTLPNSFSDDIILYDDFLFGGYGKSNMQLHSFVIDMAKNTGLILDETYTGKAFLGMTEIMKLEMLNGNSLFWHTGGLLNLFA
jgi:D-cysteine desulfhydrase